MTREEAIKTFEDILQLSPTLDETGCSVTEAMKVAFSALRPVSREQVEKVWRGEWTPGDSICPVCEKNKFDGLDADIWADWMPSFCPNCGAPMTDEAVEMVMERLEALKDGSSTD
nr:MAG TPA: Dam-replacing family [Caudoviricetes sp.]